MSEIAFLIYTELGYGLADYRRRRASRRRSDGVPSKRCSCLAARGVNAQRRWTGNLLASCQFSR